MPVSGSVSESEKNPFAAPDERGKVFAEATPVPTANPAGRGRAGRFACPFARMDSAQERRLSLLRDEPAGVVRAARISARETLAFFTKHGYNNLCEQNILSQFLAQTRNIAPGPRGKIYRAKSKKNS